MTENANPEPFNIRLKCQRCKLGRTALLGLSINQSKNPFTTKLPEQNSIKDYIKCKRVVYRLEQSVICIFKIAAVICMTKMTDQVWK